MPTASRLASGPAGIPSRPAAVFSHQGFPRRYGLPTGVGNSNHQILVIDLPNGAVTVDPTARATPFCELPINVQGADFLPYSSPGSDLQRAAVSAPTDNAETVEYRLQMSREGKTQGKFTLESRGAFAASLRHSLIARPKGKHHHVMEKWLDVVSPRAKNLVAENVAPIDGGTPLRVQGKVTLDRLLEGQGATRLLRIASFTDRWAPALQANTRQMPVIMSHNRQLTNTFTLELPDRLRVERVPEPVSLESPFGAFELTWTLEGQTIRFKRRYEIRQPVVPAAEYGALQKFVGAIHAAEARPAILRQRTGAGKTSP